MFNKRRTAALTTAALVTTVVLWTSPAFAQSDTITAEAVQANLDNVCVLLSRRARDLHAGRVRARRGRPHPGQERGQHHDEEPHGLLRRRASRSSPSATPSPSAARATTSSGPTGWFLGDGAFPYGTLTVPGDLHLPGRVRRDRGDDRVGRDGRAHEVQELLRLPLRHLGVHLPGRRALALGRRLAGPARHAVPRLRRLDHRAHGRRRRRPHGAHRPRAPHRQVRPRRQAARHPGHNIPFAVLGMLHPAGRLVRLQPRLRAGRRRRDRRHRGDDDPRRPPPVRSRPWRPSGSRPASPTSP